MDILTERIFVLLSEELHLSKAVLSDRRAHTWMALRIGVVDPMDLQLINSRCFGLLSVALSLFSRWFFVVSLLRKIEVVYLLRMFSRNLNFIEFHPTFTHFFQNIIFWRRLLYLLTIVHDV